MCAKSCELSSTILPDVTPLVVIKRVLWRYSLPVNPVALVRLPHGHSSMLSAMATIYKAVLVAVVLKSERLHRIALAQTNGLRISRPSLLPEDDGAGNG